VHRYPKGGGNVEQGENMEWPNSCGGEPFGVISKRQTNATNNPLYRKAETDARSGRKLLQLNQGCGPEGIKFSNCFG